MKALALFGAFAVAKAATLTGQGVLWTADAFVAYFWQDAAVALAAAIVFRALGRSKIADVLYIAAVIYAAINVPLARVVATPMTWTMIRAAGGPLADSVAAVATPDNLLRVFLVCAAGALLTWTLGYLPARARLHVGRAAAILGVAMTLAAVVGAGRADTAGLHRNALVAIWPRSALPVPLSAAAADYRSSPRGERRSDDLSRLRGAAAGRNVVVVVLESTAAGYLGLYGATPDPMPRLSALAAHGIVFDRAYTVYPESIRSLYALLCGRDPALDAPAEVSAAAPCAALPAAFSGRGYQTGLFHSGRFGYLGMDAVIAGRGFDALEDAGAIGGLVQSSFGVDEASTVQRVLSWIDTIPSARPFFAMYLPAAGHHPYGAATAGPFGADRDFDRYRNALAEADAALGALLDGLRARHRDEQTTVVVLGDHGEAFGQHPGNFAHSSFLFEENVRVPFVIAAPGLFDRTTRVSRVVSLLDTAPTILDLAGMPLTSDQLRRSLLQPEERPALFFTDYMSRQLGLRDGCHKVIADLDAGRTKLFDLCRDPAEREDLSARRSGLTGMYVAQLDAWRASLSPASPANAPRTSSGR